MNIELKLCPFCGGPPRMIHLHAWHVICTDCSILGKGNRRGSRDFAIKFWNTRPNEKVQNNDRSGRRN